MSPWRTIRHRHVFIRPRRRWGYYQPSAPSVARRPSSMPRQYSRKMPKYRDSGQLLKFKLPGQQALPDRVKASAVEAVRRRYGDEAAAAAGFALDQVISHSIATTDWKVEGEAHVSRTGVKGAASGEFVLPLTPAGLRLPEGTPVPELYAKAYFRFRGSLRTGSLQLAMVRAECGLRAPLPGGEASVSVSTGS